MVICATNTRADPKRAVLHVSEACIEICWVCNDYGWPKSENDDDDESNELLKGKFYMSRCSR